MKIVIHDDVVVFQEGDRVAGAYVLNDRFKPYFRTLRSPAGHETTVVSPGDHRHHKGLMYALRCEDVNFWEEDPGSGHCGVQEILKTEPVQDGIRQELLWREEQGGLHTYRELRTITCQFDKEKEAFAWRWRSYREALRDHKLVKSQWSLEIPDGRKINYHGLGIRLPWVWAHGPDDARAFNGVDVSGQPSTPMRTCGTDVPEVTWWGRIDGYWEAVTATITMRQAQRFTWFLLKGDFAYIAVGPSNAEEIDVRKGQIFDESYEVVVEDGS